KKEEKPYLQGWAIVENPSDEDWSGVRMALVSGRPISFQMNLYQPLYVPRPLVEPELFASLRPPTFEGGMPMSPPGLAGGGGGMPGRGPMAPGAAMPPGGGGFGGFGGKGEQPDLARADGKQGGLRKAVEMDKEMNLRQGARDMATASQLGDFFQYTIDQPVSL